MYMPHEPQMPMRHDERHASPAYAFLLSRMEDTPGWPTPIGVLRAIDSPSYEAGVASQAREAVAARGQGDLERLLRQGETWQVR